MTHLVEPALSAAATQIWRRLREFPDYEISNDGRLRRAVACRCRKKGALIRVSVRKRYPTYGLTKAGEKYYRAAHHLVAAEFLPPKPADKPLVLHADDNRLNCCDWNLKWGDHADNMEDAKKNNRFPSGDKHFARAQPWLVRRGEQNVGAKITEAQARALKADDRKQYELAEEYGISPSLVSRIKRGVAWPHI